MKNKQMSKHVKIYTIMTTDPLNSERCVFASLSEKKRDQVFSQATDKTKYWKSTNGISLSHFRDQLVGRLNGIERLVLGIEQRKL